MMGKYILKNKKPILVKDIKVWADWFEKSNKNDDRRVALTDIKDKNRIVSTVFLGLDHNFSGGQPILFETMVFKHDFSKKEKQSLGEEVYCDRYSTWEKAKEGHKKAVKMVKKGEIV